MSDKPGRGEEKRERGWQKKQREESITAAHKERLVLLGSILGDVQVINAVISYLLVRELACILVHSSLTERALLSWHGRVGTFVRIIRRLVREVRILRGPTFRPIIVWHPYLHKSHKAGLGKVI